MMKTHRLAALAAVLLVGSVTPANAVPVTYSTAGVFGSSGTNILSQGGARSASIPIATTVDVPPTTNAIFGSFTTTQRPRRAPASPWSTPSPLTITQTAPAPGGTVVFTSTVGGTIFLDNSQAFVQFDRPP